MSPTMDNYFAKGGRPFLLQFPPCISHICLPSKEQFAEKSTEAETADAPDTSDKEETVFMRELRVCAETLKGKRYTRPPAALHEAFPPEEVKPWEEGQFEQVEKVQDAVRNHGQVHVMRDAANGRLVAVKKMPNEWVQKCHTDFLRHYPYETEQPWQDIGCNHFLTTNGYEHGCRLLGVYRGTEHTAVVTEFASEGDLFSWCGTPTNAPPGPEREDLLRPLALQIVQGVKQLHEMAIVHRDLSLENLVMAKGQEGGNAEDLKVCVIDFGMSSTARYFHSCVSGKPSYQAPELYSDRDYDAFLTDAFAVGVSLYAAFVKDYPWLSTRPGGCKCFEFFKKNGFRKYIAKRKLRGFGGMVVADVMSEPLVRLLEGLLAVRPADRLTLGESSWAGKDRRSVFDEGWLSPDSPEEGAEASPAA